MTTTTNLAAANAIVKRAIDDVIGAGREIGVQVAAYRGRQARRRRLGRSRRSRDADAASTATRSSTCTR